MIHTRHLSSLAALLPGFLVAAVQADEVALDLPDVISFNQHVQPVLSEYCYHCHGPDSGTREPKSDPLRLDLEEHAFAVRSIGEPVIIKGDAAASELVHRINSGDRNEVMPPPESHKTMGPREIALIEKWIEQGAEYEAHWAYLPVARSEPPRSDWSDHPIDGFVFESLTAAGLEPNPDEDPRRFHRRLSFDLTGLPPEPAETDDFVTAYERDPESAIAAEADRMLAGIRSAEHFARHWLDAVRYGDTHGIHNDNFRSVWPYRDWVVRAFHSNMSWDRFTLEQMAGDLLPEPTLDQQVATGFLRALPTTGEGGAIAEEYEAIYATDRVDTMGAIWLGMTASCAACHDHKFDPLSMEEFYQLTAFFRNHTISALDRNDANHPPSIFVPVHEDRDKWVANRAAQEALAGRIKARPDDAEADFKQWLGEIGEVRVEDDHDPPAIHLPLVETEGSLHGTVDGEPYEWPAEAARADGPLGKALVVSGANIELGDIGGFAREDQVSFGGLIRIEGRANGAIIARMDPANRHRGWDLWLQNGHIAAHVIDSWPAAGDKIVASEALDQQTWHHVMVVFDGSKDAGEALAIYVDGQRVQADMQADKLGDSIGADVPLRIGARDNGSGNLSGTVALQDFRFYRRLLTEDEITALATSNMIGQLAALPDEERTPEQTSVLLEHFIHNADPVMAELVAEQERLEEEEKTVRGGNSLVYAERPNREPMAHILERGEYTNKGEQVSADTPAMLPPMPADAPGNRLGLAMWLNDPANPLPARVTMNRLWYHLFGSGIVETNGDFGIMGARPTHPALLDWLAAEFVDSGWDHRHMVKTIVTSRAYRQSGAVSPERYERDPSNTLISRGPRTRLEAEQLRDLALAASGLLSDTVGGEPVKPYQPEGVWEAVAMKGSNTRHYRQDSGEALYRRSIYTFWKRTAAPPTMEILDAPSREVFCVQRDRTNTPLQALVLMNDPQFAEAGRVLAAKAITGHESFDERLDMMTRRLLARTFEADERSVVKTTLGKAMEHYTQHPDDARLVLTVGEAEAPESIPAAELAAWSLVAGQLMNLDETLTR